jgi:hypothetical protein
MAQVICCVTRNTARCVRLHPLKGADRRQRREPGVALRLSKCLGRSPEGWLAMQYGHDLWRARKQADLSHVAKVRLTAA